MAFQFFDDPYEPCMVANFMAISKYLDFGYGVG